MIFLKYPLLLAATLLSVSALPTAKIRREDTIEPRQDLAKRASAGPHFTLYS